MQLNMPNNKSLKELLQEHRPLLLDLPDAAIKRPRVSTERATELTQHLLKNFAPLLPSLQDAFSAQSIKNIRDAFHQLPVHLFLFYAASIEVSEPWTEKEKERFKALAQKIRKDDALYMHFCRTLFLDDEETQTRLDAIQAGRGYRDDAEDVIALSRLLLSTSRSMFPNPFFTEKDVRQSEEDAIQFMWMLEGRTEGRNAKGSPPDLWHRAYTLWTQTYLSIMKAGRYLTQNREEETLRFPYISNKKQRQNSSATHNQDAEEPSSSNPTSPSQTTPPSEGTQSPAS